MFFCSGVLDFGIIGRGKDAFGTIRVKVAGASACLCGLRQSACQIIYLDSKYPVGKKRVSNWIWTESVCYEIHPHYYAMKAAGVPLPSLKTRRRVDRILWSLDIIS